MADLKLKGKWKFSKIYKAVWESNMTHKGKLVFGALEWYGDKIFPSHKTLANMCGLSPAGVKRGVKELQENGFLSWEQKVGRTNDYELFPDGNQGHLDLGHSELSQSESGGGSPQGGGVGHSELHNKTTNETKEPIPSAIAALPTISKEFTIWWHEQFLKRYGKKYVFNGAIDGMALKRITASGLSLENLKAHVIAAWDTPDERNGYSFRKTCMTIAGWFSQINKITVKAVVKATTGSGQLALQAKWKKEQEEDALRKAQ